MALAPYLEVILNEGFSYVVFPLHDVYDRGHVSRHGHLEAKELDRSERENGGARVVQTPGHVLDNLGIVMKNILLIS